jgi:hypothetical protein
LAELIALFLPCAIDIGLILFYSLQPTASLKRCRIRDLSSMSGFQLFHRLGNSSRLEIRGPREGPSHSVDVLRAGLRRVSQLCHLAGITNTLRILLPFHSNMHSRSSSTLSTSFDQFGPRQIRPHHFIGFFPGVWQRCFK